MSLSVPKTSATFQPAFESEQENKKDTSRIRKLQAMVSDDILFDQLQKELAFVCKFYSEIPKLIYKLEDNKATFLKAVELVDLIVVLFRLALQECEQCEKETARKVLLKLESGLADNHGYNQLIDICKKDANSCFNYSSLHSMDCERFFARFRQQFSAPHRQLKESIKKITACTEAFRQDSSSTKKVNCSDQSCNVQF